LGKGCRVFSSRLIYPKSYSIKLTSQMPSVDLLDSDSLAGEAGAQVDFFLAVEAEAAAAGAHDRFVVERVVRLGDALIGRQEG
jgi:hypothetical protein